jgi:replicative DNA helicase
MSANWELQLISAVLIDAAPAKRYEEALDRKITPKHFGNFEAEQLWLFISSIYNRSDNYGHIPSIQQVKETYHLVDLPDPAENFYDLCRLVKEGYVRRQSEMLVQKFLDNLDGDPLEAVEKLRYSADALLEKVDSNSDVCFNEAALAETVEELEHLDDGEGLTGIPWPWPILNDETGGIQEGDYILLWALPKSMKTWIGLYIAAHVWLTGRNVLIYSREMMWRDMRRRLACLIAKVNYTKYKKNQLSTSEKARIYETLDKLISEDGAQIWFTNADQADGSPGGPAEIRKKICAYKPQFVLLDSAYMLQMPGKATNPFDWKQLQQVNAELKQICKSTSIPMLAILQENERAAIKYKNTRGTASLAMNSGASMDCDIGIRAVKHSKKQEISLHIAVGRETTAEGFTIHGKPAEDFSYAHDHLYHVGDDFKEEGSSGVSAGAQQKISATLTQFGSMVDQFNDSEPADDEIDEDAEVVQWAV